MKKTPEKKVLAIIALIIAILALVLSWVPIVNNFAAVLAIIAFILGVIALLMNLKNQKTLSIVSVVISVIAFIIVLMTQSFYAKSIDDSLKKSDSSITQSVSKDDESSSQTSSDAGTGIMEFKVGEAAILDGVEYKVNSVSYNPGNSTFTPNAGNQYVIVNVTITNKSKDSIDYNPYDFKIDDNGNQTDLSEMVLDDSGNNVVTDPLNSGTLVTGGSVTGSMIGQAKLGDKYKLIYKSNMFDENSKITFDLN